MLVNMKHKFFILLLFNLIVLNTVKGQSIITQADSIRLALQYQVETYPASQYRDVYKNFMQDFYGPGHLLNDTTASGKYLREELASTEIFDGPDYEPTGFKGNFYRVNLRLIKNGIIPYDDFFKIFVESVQGIVAPTPQEWMKTWKEIDSQIAALGLTFNNEAQDRRDLEKQFSEGNFIAHHSKAYNESVNFHYRIVSRDNFCKYILPLLKKSY